MIVEVRGTNESLIEQILSQISQKANAIGQIRKLQVSSEITSCINPVEIEREIINGLTQASNVIGAESLPVVSRAVHDAMFLAQHGLVGMLFVCNPAGISHNPAEMADDDDIELIGATLATYLHHATVLASDRK